VQRVSRILSDIEHVRLRQVNQHLGRRLRVQSELKCERYSIDGAGFHRLLNGFVRSDDRSEWRSDRSNRPLVSAEATCAVSLPIDPSNE